MRVGLFGHYQLGRTRPYGRHCPPLPSALAKVDNVDRDYQVSRGASSISQKKIAPAASGGTLERAQLLGRGDRVANQYAVLANGVGPHALKRR